jgi:chromate transporter
MHELSPTELWQLFVHFLGLSLLAVGGAITATPGMHRHLVTDKGWLSEVQFTDSIALAQAAPGPNVLFVAVMGWNVAGGWGVLATLSGILLPSTTVALWASRWQGANRQHPAVQAFTHGMAPITLGLLLATSWLLIEPALRTLWQAPLRPITTPSVQAIGSLVLFVFTVIAMLRRQLGPLALTGIGGAVGAVLTLMA